MTTETSPPAAPAPVSTPAPEAAPAPSLDEQLSAVYDEMNPPAAAKAPAPPQTSKRVAEALTVDAEHRSVTDTDEPDLPLEDKTPSDPPKEAGKSEPAQSSPAIAAPNSWSADVKAVWSSIPPKAQEYIAAREKEAHAKITQQGNELRAYQPFREINEHIRTAFGVPAGREAEVVANWARAQQVLDSNPVEGLKWLANSYKVDLAQLVAKPETQANSESIDDLFRDPRLDRIAPEVSELRHQLSALQRQLQARQSAELSERQSQVEQIISEFTGRDDVKDLWADLEADTVHEIEVLKAQEPSLTYDKLLEKAFERAKWANPNVRTRILSDQQRKDQEAFEQARKKEAEEAAKKAAQAKKLASMNVRTGATASTPTFDGKWDDPSNLNALYDRITAGSR